VDAWGGKGVWETLRHDVFKKCGFPVKSPKLQISIRIIEVPDEVTGVKAKASDLRTDSDNDAAADFILQTLSPFVDAVDNHVVASIAGGRKTMGALLYAAMSLVGKHTDRVTHVLVSEPFEMVRGFYYPTQPVRVLAARVFGQDTVSVDVGDAKVQMADMPFVALRYGFVDLQEPRRTFAGMMSKYGPQLRKPVAEKPRVRIDLESGTLHVESAKLSLRGRDLVVSAFLLARALESRPLKPFVADLEGEFESFFAEWKATRGTDPKTLTYMRSTPSGVHITKVLSVLRDMLVTKGMDEYIPYLAPKRGRIGFEIKGLGDG
jgi:CRISPR-associated protein (TIGR02584 family)